ncbi:glycosyltransferase family 4 protein [Gracilimonas sp.]|uniref:glycosyltransferase family 4 protein n=1 Tax=Gracilimonas sp. TaxID=1974203 RepID=UPI00287135C1|nr:glycosyltransferase family 4 protein [Gracilimonas sp.]
MKVGIIVPMSIAAVNGGLRTQVNFTVNHLRNFGVEPAFISPFDDLEKSELDLVHVFGSSVENSGIVSQLKQFDIPIILSPVFYSNRSASFIAKTIKIERFLERFGSGIRSDFSIKAKICAQADLIIPNTKKEAEIVSEGFSISNDNIAVIPNGVEERFAKADPELFHEKYGITDFVCFAGQAGAPRKNVELLLKSAPSLNAPLVIIGDFSDNDYGSKCKKIAAELDTVTLIDSLDHDSDLLASAYAACKVFVLPSQYETPGIAAMEAALSGSNIVITEKGGTKEYFLDYAEYIKPGSKSSLIQRINQALSKTSSNSLRDHILNNYTWHKVAELTYNQYKRVLS